MIIKCITLWRLIMPRIIPEPVSSSGDSGDITYTPTTPGDWDDPDPTTVQEALDDLAGAGGGGLGGGSWFYADTLINPGTGWTVTAFAGLAVDSNDAELLARLFDDTTEEGVGIPVFVPSAATSVSITIVCRAETGATANIGWRAYGMTSGDDGAAPGAWSSAHALATVAVTDETWNHSANTGITLGTLNLTAGAAGLIEVTRNTGVASDLTGDAAVQGIYVEWA
jgi:hypothetical protein